MPPFLIPLLGSGLNLIANAVLGTGKAWIEEKTGVKIQPDMSSDDLLKLKQFELENEIELQRLAVEDNKLDVELAKLQVAETANARQHDVEIATSANAPMLNKLIVPILALIVVLGGGLILMYVQQADTRMAAVSMMTLVLGFYFGTSVGSQKAQEHLRQLVDTGGSNVPNK